jgi:hydroxypyruvate isomerase
MSSISQSLAWWCFVPEKLNAEEFVRAVAEAGYAAIDLVPPAYYEMVASQGLAISSVAAHQSITVGLNRRDQHDRIEKEIIANLADAQKWHIPNLICFSGNRDLLDDVTGGLIVAEGLTRVAPAAEQAGVTLVVELLNSKVDHPDYQADHTEWGVRVCRAVASTRVKLLYDVYHMQIMEGDIIRTIRAHHDWIGFYHTAGNPGRNDLDQTQELYYPAILNAIRETNYSGYLAHEFIPKGDPIAALRAVYRQCAPHLSSWTRRIERGHQN